MKKAIKKIKKFFVGVGKLFVLLLTGYSKDAVDDGICDYSGQGRDKYGN